MRLLRLLRKILVGLFAVIGALVFLSGVAGYMASQQFAEREQPLSNRVVLTLDLSRGIAERSAAGPFAWTEFNQGAIMRELVLALEAAARDDRIKGVAARLGTGPVGMAQAQEIRDAIKNFRQSGKFALAFAETFGETGDGNIHYYLATAFDEIWLQPSGDVRMTGFRLESPYFKTALDTVGVTSRIDQREEFKGAFDPFTKASMPAPVRDNLQGLVDSWMTQLASGIAEARQIAPGAARALIDRGPFLAADALGQKLVDKLAYWDEFDGAVGDRAGSDAQRLSVSRYAATLAPPPDAAEIAVVYGVGPVHLSARESDPLFGDFGMGSRSVSKAIRDAVADPGVKAIIFRVDSPGGSYVASDAIWREVERARLAGKPLIVSMGDVAASGGYFVAAPAQKIVAQPATITGSIGVLSGKFVLQELWRKLEINWEGVQAGANAGIDSTNLDYSAAEWANLQAGLDRVYGDFTDKVASGRKLPIERIRAVAKGQIWTGADAREHGLVDELGGFSVAIRLAREAAGIAIDTPVAVNEYPKVDNSLEGLMGRLLSGELFDEVATSEAVATVRLVKMLAPVAKALAPLLEDRSAQAVRLPELDY
ncbi:MAG: signal peptide peptidase SppA [Dongiaceae bacterium]